QYVVGVQSSMTVWESGKQPLPAKPRGKMGRPPRLLHRSPEHQPVAVKQLAMLLPPTAYKDITWREGTEQKLRSRFAAVRIRPVHRDYWQAEPHAEEWVLIEWPKSEKEPTKYWISTLPENTTRKALIKIAKHRWIIERDHEELKQELGLAFRRSQLAGVPPSRNACPGILRVSGGRANPFFPLRPRRSSWIHCPQVSAGIPPTRFAAYAPSGITPTRSQHSA